MFSNLPIQVYEALRVKTFTLYAAALNEKLWLAAKLWVSGTIVCGAVGVLLAAMAPVKIWAEPELETANGSLMLTAAAELPALAI